MESIIVEGGRPLEGKVSISGAKNSVLPLLAAAILFRAAVCYITAPGYPMAAAAEILEHLGCRVDRTGHSIWVDAQICAGMRSPGPDGADAFVHPVSGAVAGPYRPVHLI